MYEQLNFCNTQDSFQSDENNRPNTKKEPRRGCNRALLLFLNLYANVQLVKRDIVTAVIYCYITTEFHYAKQDSRCHILGIAWVYRDL